MAGAGKNHICDFPKQTPQKPHSSGKSTVIHVIVGHQFSK
jgi:hypothetical protein